MDHNIKQYVPSIETVLRLKSGSLLELLIANTPKGDERFIQHTTSWLEIAFLLPDEKNIMGFPCDGFNAADFERLIDIGLAYKHIDADLWSKIIYATEKYDKHLLFGLLIRSMRLENHSLPQVNNQSPESWLIQSHLHHKHFDEQSFEILVEILAPTGLNTLTQHECCRIKQIAELHNKLHYLKYLIKYPMLRSKDFFDLSENGFFSIDRSVNGYHLFINANML